jgi:hypothetical protein
LRPDESESSEKLLHALLITQISKEDYKDFWTFSEISELSIDRHLPNFYIRINLFGFRMVKRVFPLKGFEPIWNKSIR